MKPFRFSAFSRCLFGTAAVITLTHQASAQTQLYWKTSAAAAEWATAANWSTTAAANGTAPANAPGNTAVANFSGTTPPNTGAQIVMLPALPSGQAVQGLATPAQTALTTIRSDGSAATALNLGSAGIKHTTGGLTIGSSTAAQGVEVKIAANQTWDSSTAGTGAAALVVHNNVTYTATATGSDTEDDLTLEGINTGSAINGNITTGGTKKLNVVKWGSGLWTLAGTANNITGLLLVNEGTIRLTNAGAATPSRTFVAPGATLSLRTGGTGGFTSVQLNTYLSFPLFDLDFSGNPPTLALDTTGGNFQYDTAFASDAIYRFNKLGGNTLTLTANNSGFPKSTTVTEGTLALATPNAKPGLITVETNGTLAAVAGGAGFTVSEIEALIASTTFNGTGSFGISTANADVIYPAVLSGSLRFNKTAANTLVLSADNTYTGATVISGGSLSVPKISNSGIAGPLGASPNAATNLVLAGGRLVYTGPTATTDRLFSMTTNAAIEASGMGALTLGAGAITQSGNASARILTLSGINQGLNTLPAVLSDSGTGTNVTSLYKTGYGNWTLTGANTFTGFVRGRGGNITLDYTGTDPLAGNVLIQSGTVELKAAASGTAETIPILQVGESHNGLGILKLTGNLNLTVSTFEGSGNSQRNNLIDLGTGGAINVTALNTTTNHIRVNATTGLILNSAATEGSSPTGRANIVLRATDGTYGFAAFAPGATAGQLQKLNFPSESVLTPGATPVAITSNTTNYYLGAGSYTTTAAAVNFSTLTLDSGAGPVEFAVAESQRIGPTSTGKSILTSGANDITISGGNTTNLINQPTWFHNYLNPSATLNITSNIGNASYFIIGGTGYTNYSGTGLGLSGSTQFVQNGGVLRLTNDQDLNLATGVLRVTDGIFEIGADLNGTGEGDFSRASDPTSFRLLGNAGFSAYTTTPGGTRVVGFSNPAPLVWGAADFLTNSADNLDGDYAFRFGSARSNATIQFTNAINLNGRLRAVEVANGSAETDAVLSGVLSGSSVSGLVKTGLGTLSLTGLNTYGGETRVMEGVLKVKAGSIPAGSRLVIGPAGKLDVSGNVGVQSVVINGVEQGPGVVISPDYITGGGALYVGAAPAGMTYAQWVTNKGLQPAESGELFDADKDGLLNLLEYGLGTEPKVPNGSVLTQNAGNSGFRFNRATDRTDITTVIESSETLTGVWSTIATSTGTGAFVLGGGVTGVTINETTPGTVIVTTSPTGAPVKKFHRVRVTK